MKYKAILDSDFRPFIIELKELSYEADKPVIIVIEDADGFNFVYNLKIGANNERNYNIVERLIKSLIWVVGGSKVYVFGADEIVARLKSEYAHDGIRAFDADFMRKVYGSFEIVATNNPPKEKRRNIVAGGNVEGCRIGFDAGGSDRKVSAVIDGEVVFSEEVVWFPKINANPEYHFEGIVSAFKTAASKMPCVDAIGVSSAGIYINNRTCAASLFLKVPEEKFDRIRDIYINAAKEIGEGIPLEVANDGDVTAIAGAISFGSNCVLGIAMGTSEAGGYVNAGGGLNGWLTELAFVPCDLQKNAPLDEWSGDIGTGVNYFSQDAVIRLAPVSGIKLDSALSPAEKLKVVQELMAKGDERAKRIYETIGIYLGYTLPFYAQFYEINNVLVLGRVMSGLGGDLIVATAKKVLSDEFPELKIEIVTPDEKFKRVGQSIAAASLPQIRQK